MVWKGGTLGFPSASFLSSGGGYHVQMTLQVIVDIVLFPLFAPQLFLLSIRIRLLGNKKWIHSITKYLLCKAAMINIFKITIYQITMCQGSLIEINPLRCITQLQFPSALQGVLVSFLVCNFTFLVHSYCV